jgi:hypothetical protein
MMRLQDQRLPTYLFRLALVGGLLVADLALGYVAVRVAPSLFALAIFAPFAALLMLARAEYGVLALLFTAAFVRASLPTGTQSRIVASLLLTAALTAAWILRMAWVDRRLHLKPARFNAPLLGIIAVSFVSYLWSNVFRDPLVVVWRTWPVVQLGALGVMVLLPCASLLVANGVSDPRWLRWMWGLMVAMGAAKLVVNLTHLPIRFINTGGLFSLWLVALVYARLLFDRALRPLSRALLILLLGLWLYQKLVVEVYWLSGWVPPLLAMAVITFLRSKKACIALLVIIALYVLFNWGYYGGTVFSHESAESGVTRLAAWAQNWRVTGQHLLFGTGPAGYAAYYMTYFPTRAMATHSNYIDILSQLGIVGLGFYVWFLVAQGRTGLDLWGRVRGRQDWVEGLAAGMLGGLVGLVAAMGLGDWLIPFVYTQTIAGFDYALYGWMWLGAMTSLAHYSFQNNPSLSLTTP